MVSAMLPGNLARAWPRVHEYLGHFRLLNPQVIGPAWNYSLILLT